MKNHFILNLLLLPSSLFDSLSATPHHSIQSMSLPDDRFPWFLLQLVCVCSLGDSLHSDTFFGVITALLHFDLGDLPLSFDDCGF